MRIIPRSCPIRHLMLNNIDFPFSDLVPCCSFTNPCAAIMFLFNMTREPQVRWRVCGKPPHFLSSFGTRDAGAFERSCSFDIIVSILWIVNKSLFGLFLVVWIKAWKLNYWHDFRVGYKCKADKPFCSRYINCHFISSGVWIPNLIWLSKEAYSLSFDCLEVCFRKQAWNRSLQKWIGSLFALVQDKKISHC